MNESWTVTYRNRNNGQRITAAVFAADRQQALDKAYADGLIDGHEAWEVENIEPHEETLARIFISEFAEKQQGGHFACPRCGKMAMNAESVTRNALSRRATVYICDACGTAEALEDMAGDQRPLTAWAIVSAPENWRMEEDCSENAPKLTCPVCRKELQREDMTFTRDCHGITFRLVCFDCYDKVMGKGYDGAYYSEADECIEEDY